jgi:hypothetical protein
VSRAFSIAISAFGLLLACTRTAGRGSTAADSDVAPRWSYEIRIDETLERMDLGLCIDGPQPRQLITADESGLDFVRSASVRGGVKLARDDRGFTIDTLGEHGCIDLEIDLSAAVAGGGRDSGRSGDTLMLGPERWLWYPSDVPADVDARARFELPEGIAVTAPWPHEADGWRRLDHTSFGWSAWIAFGRYQPLEFTVEQCEFEVAVLDGERTATNEGIEAWLRVAAEVSAELHGRFPRERVSVVVVPRSGWGSAPVLFGMARRGGGGSVMLLLDHDAEDHELVGEWVATHELLHLGFPWINDPWMGEGFVTYYTTLLSARRGVLVNGASRERQTEVALGEFAHGFRRGSDDDVTLGRASETMHSSHSYGRVYWGGAAIALDLDLRIRAATANHRSLDDLMCTLAPFAPEHRMWTASEVLAQMDAELQRWHEAGELSTEISLSLTNIAVRHLEANSIPLHVRELEGLAVEVPTDQGNSGRVRLLADPSNEAQTRQELFEKSLDAARSRLNVN